MGDTRSERAGTQRRILEHWREGFGKACFRTFAEPACLGGRHSAPNLARRLDFQIGPGRAPWSAPPPKWRLGTARNPAGNRQQRARRARPQAMLQPCALPPVEPVGLPPVEPVGLDQGRARTANQKTPPLLAAQGPRDVREPTTTNVVLAQREVSRASRRAGPRQTRGTISCAAQRARTTPGRVRDDGDGTTLRRAGCPRQCGKTRSSRRPPRRWPIA